MIKFFPTAFAVFGALGLFAGTLRFDNSTDRRDAICKAGEKSSSP